MTDSELPSLPTEIVCATPSAERSIAHADGGDTPLAVFAVGSGVVQSVPAGADVAPSDCVVGVEPATAPVVEPPVPAPDVPVVPDGLCASVVPQSWAPAVVVLCVPVGWVASVVLGAVTELVSVPVGSLVVVIVVVVVSVGAAMVLLFVAPTTVVSTGGVDVASESELPEETVPDCGDVIVVGSDDVIVVLLDTAVLALDDDEAVPSVALEGGGASDAD